MNDPGILDYRLRVEAVGWLRDCFPDCPDDLTDREVMFNVGEHYDGGWQAFARASAELTD